MSNGEEAQGQHYTSAIDSAFSAAWNAVVDAEESEAAAEGGNEAGTPALGDAASAPVAEGAGAEESAAAASTERALAGLPGIPVDDAGAAGQAGAGEPSADAGSDDGNAAAAQAAVPTVTYSVVVPQIEAASRAIEENATKTFRAQATQELHEAIGPKYAEALRKHPRMLVGEKVPSLRGEGEETIRDSADAREWQEAAAQLIEAEIQNRVTIKSDEVKPMMSVLQESVLLFQNNQDLIPNTAEFDKELADEFAAIASDYELRVNGQLYGYQVNVQPLINRLRTSIAARRGANGQQQLQQRQQQVAQQQRNADTGQFEAPQVGIPSKAGGVGDSGEDYTTFWGSALNLGSMRV